MGITKSLVGERWGWGCSRGRRGPIPCEGRFCVKAVKKKDEEEVNGFKRGGKGRDSCSPEICVDILVVDGAGYLVVSSGACL